MKKVILLGMVVTLVNVGIVLFFMFRTTNPEIKSIDQQIAVAPQKWKDAYGDNLETQLVFNVLLLHQSIMNLHPNAVVKDANE